MCVPNDPLFQYMISPLFSQQKVYDWPDFSCFVWERPHFPDIPVYAYIFFETACSLGIQWFDCDICLLPAINRYKKTKGQYMNRSTFWTIKYMNGSICSKARYMNRVGFEILARTSVPQLPPSYHLPWDKRFLFDCSIKSLYVGCTHKNRITTYIFMIK